MADSFSSDKVSALLQGDGDNENTWGSRANSETIQSITKAIAGYEAIDAAGSGDLTLTTAQARNAYIKLTGTLTGNRNVIVPTSEGGYIVWNATSASYTVTVKTSAGTGITVTQGGQAILWCDGTNVVKILATDDGIAEVSEDTTPQLGGPLDSNSHQINLSKGSDVASGTALTLGTDGNFFDITGTTAIETIGTLGIGTVVRLQFDGILTLTNHATDLILPGGANITTAAGDTAELIEYATGDWLCLRYTRAAALPLDESNGIKQGVHTIFIPAGAMTPTVSNGCAALTQVETTAGRPDLNVLYFDATADEHAQFQIAFPDSWDEGPVTYRSFWMTTATDTDGVAWSLQGVAVSDGDTADVAYGTAVVVTDDAQSAAEDVLVTDWSGDVTIAGTPAAGDMCFFRAFRDVSDGNDDMTEDAGLIGIQVRYTVNASDDS